MRTSTSMQFGLGVFYMQQKQQALQKLYEQITTQQKVVRAGDDPVAAAQSFDVDANATLNLQYVKNAGIAKDHLAITDSTLQDVGNVITRVRELALSANKTVLSSNDRTALRTELKEATKTLVQLMNTQSAEGSYIFAGTSTSKVPFDYTLEPNITIRYQGNSERQELPISATRTLPMTEPGNVVAGETSAVQDLSYTSTDPVTGLPNLDPVTNQPIEVYWLDNVVATPPNAPSDLVRVNKDPDAFTEGNELFQAIERLDTLLMLGPSDVNSEKAFDRMLYAARGYDVFPPAATPPADMPATEKIPTTADFLAYKTYADKPEWDLGDPQEKPSGSLYYLKGLDAVLDGLDKGFERVVATNTVIGARMNAAESVESVGEGLNVHYANRLQQLVGLDQDDYVKAISDYKQAEAALGVSQQVFAQISKLSLFNYL